MERERKMIATVALLKVVAGRYPDLTPEYIRCAGIKFTDRSDGIEVQLCQEGIFELWAYVAFCAGAEDAAIEVSIRLNMYHTPAKQRSRYLFVRNQFQMSRRDVAEEGARWPEDRS